MSLHHAKGVWLQDWVGMRHSWDGDRLIWNWELNKDWYPGKCRVPICSNVKALSTDHQQMMCALISRHFETFILVVTVIMNDHQSRHFFSSSILQYFL